MHTHTSLEVIVSPLNNRNPKHIHPVLTAPHCLLPVLELLDHLTGFSGFASLSV